MRSVLLAALLFALAALTLILLRPLTPIDETRYLAAAWEMRIGGSPWVPHLNGALYGHKPPLLFWLVNLVWALTGVSEFAARLVGPAFAVLSVALTGLLARRLWPGDPARAGAAALILAVSPMLLLYGSTTMFDAMLSVAALAAMLALWSAVRHPRPAAWIGLGAAIALGVYAKGPVILVHVLPAVLAVPLWAGSSRPSARVLLGGAALALGVAVGLVALWLVPALILGGAEYRFEVLWRQSSGRMMQSFAHQRPMWFFVALLPLMLWPFGWTGRGLSALHPRRLWAEPATRFVTIWFGGALLAFSLISGKQAHYLLPEMPALALLLAGGMPAGGWRRQVWLVMPLLLLIAGLLAAALGLVPVPAALGDALPFWALALGTGIAAVGIAAFVRLRNATAALGALPLALLIALHFALSPMMFARYDMTALGRAVAPYDGAGIAVTDGTYHAQLNFAGRLRSPVARIDQGEAAAWLRDNPGGILLDRSGSPPDGATPVARLPYRGGDYTLYRSQEAAP